MIVLIEEKSEIMYRIDRDVTGVLGEVPEPFLPIPVADLPRSSRAP
jgi:hypothetical protein